MVGTKKSEELTWGSTVHGAGRVKSRSAALREHKIEKIQKDLDKKGIKIKPGSLKVLAAEAPEAYKDIDEVINSAELAGLSKKVARMIPLGVTKG